MKAIVQGVIRPLARGLLRTRFALLPLGRREAAFWAAAYTNYPSLFESFGHDQHVTVEVFPGIRMRLGLRDRVQKMILSRGEWDPATANALRVLLRPGDTFIDVGANVGYLSLLASTLVGPRGRVWSFEPSLRPLLRLVEHLELNRITNVLVNSLGLADRSAVMTFYRADASNIGKSSLGLAEGERAAEESILTLRLDDYLAGVEIAPRVIKIDVEGAELLALRGMERLLRERSPLIICEVIDRYLRKLGGSARELEEFLAGLGYQPYVAVPEGRSVRWKPASRLDERPDDEEDILFAREIPPELRAVDSRPEVAHAGG